jgi:outer membrane protein assembly factor BamB
MTHSDFNLEQRLIAALQQEASVAMTTTDTKRELERWRDQRDRRKNRLQIGLAVAAAAAVVAVILGITLGLGGSDDSRREPIKRPQPIAPQTSTVESVDPVPNSTPVVTAKGPVNPGSVAFGAVWATGLEESADRLYRLNPDSGKILSSTTFTPDESAFPIPVRVGDVVLVAAMQGKQSGYAAFDKNGEPAGFIRVAEPGAITGDASGGWIRRGLETIARVDSSGLHVVRTIHLPDPEDNGVVLSGMAMAGDALYLALQGPGGLYHLDAATGEVVDKIDLLTTTAGVAASPDAIYIATEDYKLQRYDNALKLTATSDNAISEGSFYIPIVTSDGLWVTPNQGGIVELDATTLKPLRSFQILPHKDAGFDFGGAVTDSRLFVGSIGPSRVASIPRD